MNDLISKLSEIRSGYNCFNQDEEPYYRALSEAISILITRYTYGDTISRKAAIDAIVNTPSEVQNKNIPLVNQYDGATFRQIEILGILEALPSVERLGQWEDIEHAPNGLMYVTCSVCGKRQTVEFTSYCPNCGAKMDKVENE